jgi:hypothetical protein
MMNRVVTGAKRPDSQRMMRSLQTSVELIPRLSAAPTLMVATSNSELTLCGLWRFVLGIDRLRRI